MGTVEATIEAAVYLANKEFIKGFLIGQVICIISILFIINFFLLNKRTLDKKHIISINSKPKQSKLMLLNKLNISINQTNESLNCLNILMAQLIDHYRSNSLFLNQILHHITTLLNSSSRPAFIVFFNLFQGDISISDVSFGEHFPMLSNARLIFLEQQMVFRFNHSVLQLILITMVFKTNF
jgi:hypothetical protein